MSLKIDKVQLDIIINNDQSRASLRKLDDEIRLVQKDLKKLPEGSKEWIAQSDKLKGLQKQYENVKREIGLTGLSLKELRAHQKELNAVMQNMNPKLPQYKILQAELSETKNRISELTLGAKSSGLSMGKMADGFNKYFALTTAALASLTGVIFGFKKLVEDFNAFEKKLANLSALTGLAGDDLTWLSDKAKELSTSVTDGGIKITSSADEIVDAFTKMGSAKPELLKDKDALAQVTEQALILKEASQGELEPTVESLANTMNQFGAGADEAARYINVLASGSKEGSAEVQDISDSIVKFGAAAGVANVSVEESVAMIETLAEKGIKGEIAGRGLKGVLLELMSGADATNPKVVGLSKALDNLKGQNLSAAEMVKRFGQENYMAAQIITNGSERVDYFTKAVTGTNVATEQAIINTSTNSAKLEQAKNKAHLMALELGEKLAPALTFSTNAFSYFLKAVLASIKFFNEHRTAILSVTAGIVAYATVVKVIIPLTENWGKITAWAQKTMVSMNNAMKSNPWGLLAAAIATAATFLYQYLTRTKEISSAQALVNKMKTEYVDKLAEESGKMNLLFASLKKENLSKEARATLIKQMNTAYGKYLPNLLTEKSTLAEINKAQKAANTSLENNIRLKLIEENSVAIIKEKKNLEDLNSGYKLYISDLEKAQAMIKTKDTGKMFGWEYTSWVNEVMKKFPLAQKAIDEADLFGKDTQSNILEYTRRISENNKKLKENATITNSLQNDYDKLLSNQIATPIEEPLSSSGATASTEALADAYEKLNTKISEYQKLQKAALAEGKYNEAATIGNRIRKLRDEKASIDELAEALNSLPTKMNKISAKKRELAILDTSYTDEYLINVAIQTAADQKRLQDVTVSSKNEYEVKKAALDAEIASYDIIGKLDVEQLAEKEKLTASLITLNENYQKSLDDNIKAIGDSLKASANAVENYVNFKTQQDDQEFKHFSEGIDKEREALDKQYASGLISKASYDKKVLGLEKKLDKEQARIQIAAAKRNAEIGLVQQAIDTAIAIVSAIKLAFSKSATVWDAIAGAALAVGEVIALVAATSKYNDAAKNLPQAAKGKYPVVGADDGKTYNAEYINNAGTKILDGPAILAGEDKPEIIIDPKRTQQLMNYPAIMNAILFGKMPQAAKGKYPTQIVSQGNSAAVMSDPNMLLLLAEISKKLDYPTRAVVTYTDIENTKAKVDATRANFNG